MYIKATDPAIQKNFHKLVEKAKYELHESFKNPVRYVECKPGKVLQLESGGWGYFDLPCTFYFRKETGKIDAFSYTWPLSFEGTGKSTKFKFTFNGHKIRQLLS